MASCQSWPVPGSPQSPDTHRHVARLLGEAQRRSLSFSTESPLCFLSDKPFLFPNKQRLENCCLGLGKQPPGHCGFSSSIQPPVNDSTQPCQQSPQAEPPHCISLCSLKPCSFTSLLPNPLLSHCVCGYCLFHGKAGETAAQNGDQCESLLGLGPLATRFGRQCDLLPLTSKSSFCWDL